MKGCGRSNSATGLRRHAWWLLCSCRCFEERHLSLPLVCMLTTVAVALAATRVFAAGKPGSSSPLPSDGVVYASSSAGAPVYSDNPPAASPMDSSSDTVVEPPPIGGAASAVPAPGVVSSPGAAGLSPESVGRRTGATATTTEIPPAAPGTAASSGEPAAAAGQQVGPADYDDGIIRYEHAKDPEVTGPPIGSLQDFMSEGDITSPLGIEVREDKRRLKGGGEAHGLLIVDVFAGSPAAQAGLHPYHRAVRDVLETAAVAGAMFMPPAVLLVPVFDQVRLGETYDLIIAVDGSRVTNFLDFQERLRDLQAGEIVYLSIVRNGARMQIAVPVPVNSAAPTF